MTFISAFKTANNFATIGLHIPGGALQRLNAWLLVYRNHQGILRRIQIESHNIGRFWNKLWIGAHTPTSLAAKTYTFFAQQSPDRMHRGLQFFGERGTVPACLTEWRRKFQGLQNLIAKFCVILLRLSGTGAISKPLDPLAFEASTPFNNSIWANLQVARNFGNTFALQTFQNDFGSFYQASFHGSTLSPFFQSPSVFLRTSWYRWFLGHRVSSLPKNLQYNYYLCK